MTSFEYDDRLPTRDSAFVHRISGELAAAAQSVYDDWLQDDDGMDEVYGAGGICHDIADRIVSVLSEKGIEAVSVPAAVGENHVFAVAALADGVWSIDIPPNVYEAGGGYVWRKLPDVTFTPEHLDFFRISTEALTGDQLSERFCE